MSSWALAKFSLASPKNILVGDISKKGLHKIIFQTSLSNLNIQLIIYRSIMPCNDPVCQDMILKTSQHFPHNKVLFATFA